MAMYKYIVMVGFEFVDIECKHFSTVVIYVAKKTDGAFSAKVLERLILLGRGMCCTYRRHRCLCEVRLE